MAEVQDRHRKAASVYSSHGYDEPIVCTCRNCTRTAQALADQEERVVELARQLAREQEENGRKLQEYDDDWTKREGRARVLSAGLFEDLAYCVLDEPGADARAPTPHGRGAKDLQALEALRRYEHKDEFHMYFDGHDFCVKHRGGLTVADDPADALVDAMRPEPEVTATTEGGSEA